MRADAAVPSQDDAGADGDECADTTARTDLGARFDYRVGPISGDASPRASGSTSAKA